MPNIHLEAIHQYALEHALCWTQMQVTWSHTNTLTHTNTLPCKCSKLSCKNCGIGLATVVCWN